MRKPLISILPSGKKKRTQHMRRQPRVYLSVSSEGYGHSSRAIAIANQFTPDEILIGTYSYALERVKSLGYPCVPVPQEVKFFGDQGSFDVGKTILKNPTTPIILNQSVQDEMDLMEHFGISLVVADGRISPVLAAARLDLPCVVMTNQSAFYPFFERDSALVKLLGLSFEWMMTYWLSSAEEILIPDFPPPYTVCLPNLSDQDLVKKRTRFVGPLVSWQAEDVAVLPALPLPQRRRIVASLGGHSYRRPLFDAVLAVARQFPDIRFEVLSTFEAVEPLPINVKLHSRVLDCAPYFKSADLVITQAGHSTAMELLTLGKPSIVVPDCRQAEQENNAQRLAELGVSCKLEYQDLGVSSLADTIDQMLTHRSYRQQAEVLAAQAQAIHGAAHTATVLREYANRLLAY
ncbi:MAG: glycosyltransferase [Candidatus Melainabacteria bacterium]|nr:glycosyltransferase [Candidatus Melainabacteria bacterium]